jgi:WS/DGAT/MGAT family acyltransferase
MDSSPFFGVLITYPAPTLENDRAIMGGMAKPERLSFDDAQILRLESEVIKGHTGKVLVLGPGERGERLRTERLRARIADRIESIPRLRQRVAGGRRGRPAWVDAPDLDLGWHLADAAVSEPVSDRRLRELTGEILGQRLDHERPLWRIDVIPLERERTALVGRIHHAMADGVSAIHLVADLLWDELAGTPPSGAAGAAQGTEAAAPAPEGRGTSAGAEPRRGAARLAGTLRRELQPGPDTALDRHIGPQREVAWTGFPLERLKRIEHGAGEGITVNDVVLAVVAGALRRWLDADGRPESLRVQVPVCLHLRTEGANQVGNKDSFLNIDLPLEEPDALTRLRLINAETRERKLDHDADTMYAFFHALGRFRPLYRGVTRLTSGPREFALSVSNVPGPPQIPLVLGHLVGEFSSFAEPADRHALRVSVISLGGNLAFGLCSDPDAIAGLERFADALEESVAELEASAGGADADESGS